VDRAWTVSAGLAGLRAPCLNRVSMPLATTGASLAPIFSRTIVDRTFVRPVACPVIVSALVRHVKPEDP
jgi:hypothetical protein